MKILTYNDQTIEQRADGYVNATQMAKANDVRLDNYFASKNTIGYLDAFRASLEFSDLEPVYTSRDPNSKNFGTWLHPIVAIHFAQWISPSFYFWCNTHIKTLIETGTTTLVPGLSASPALIAAREVKEINDALNFSPRLAQLLIDSAVNFHLETKAIAGQEAVLRGAVEIAAEMGFKTNHSNRSQLGKFVASQIGYLAQREMRLCNGINMMINCYPDTDEVRSVIARFFDN